MRPLQTASTGDRVRSRLAAVHCAPVARRLQLAPLTAPAPPRRDYVSTMRAVRCLLFAAVFARCSVTGLREGWQPPAEDLVQPKRLLQQIHTQGELLHSRLDTRVQNLSKAAQPVHLARSSFRVEAFGSSFILDLELNHHLLSTDYVERHFEEDGQPSQIKMKNAHLLVHIQ